MSLDKLLFAIVLVICAVLAVTMLVPEAPDGHGVTHPDFPSMSHGVSAVRHERVLWLGWAFGTLQILLFVCLMAFGARKRERLRGLGRPLLYGAAAFIAVWTLLVIAYQRYMGEATHKLFLAFPVPTAIMIYGLWPIPLVFTLLFVIGFKRWYLTDQDLDAFDRLLERKREASRRDP